MQVSELKSNERILYLTEEKSDQFYDDTTALLQKMIKSSDDIRFKRKIKMKVKCKYKFWTM